MDFLEFGEDTATMFPLFLEPQDKYVDEEETARKMLRETILSHVKNNYISTNNYISVNKNKNVNTNNTFNEAKKEERVDPRRKLDFGLEREDYTLKNEGRGRGRQEYANNLGPGTPKSATSQIKNQSKEIIDLVNKDISAKKDRSREAMPEFYVEHIRNSGLGRPRGKSIGGKSGQPDSQMSRSKTEKYLSSQPPPVQAGRLARANLHSSGIEVLSRNSNGEDSPIKKTASEYFPVTRKEPAQKMSSFNIISEQEKEEEEYRSRNVGKPHEQQGQQGKGKEEG